MYKYTIELAPHPAKNVQSINGSHFAWTQDIFPPTKKTPRQLLEEIFFTMVPFTAAEVSSREVRIIGVEKNNPTKIILDVRGKVADLLR